MRWTGALVLVMTGGLAVAGGPDPQEKEIDWPAFMQRQGMTFDHRHFSNLLMIYPLFLVNIEQPGTMDVLQRSYDRAYATKGLPAMVEAHAGPIGAVIGRGDDALDGLKRLQRDLYPNGLWFDSPCIESTLATANIIQNMLIQSWSDPTKEESGPIRIFPAVPTAWQDVEFHDLRAEGAFLVSAKRCVGRTQWVRIKSLASEPCRVRPGMSGEIGIKGDRPFQFNQISPRLYQIDLKKGEEVLLQSELNSPPPPAAGGGTEKDVRMI